MPHPRSAAYRKHADFAGVMFRLPAPSCGQCVLRTLKPRSTATHNLARSTTQRLAFSTRPLNPLSKRPTSTPVSLSFRRLQSQFQPLRPPTLEELGRAAPARTYRRTRKWLRRLIRLAIASGIILALDTYYYDACITRSVRTFYTGLYVAIDYKINFQAEPWFGDSVADLHARSARRLFELLSANGGLYLKIGQAIAMQSAILPPEFQKMFASLFDDAPQNTWEEVQQVIREDFGKEPEEVFGVSFTGDLKKGIMERTARASASVAQVHWARLADGREVAIKVQKREIARQVGWDLWAFKVVTRIYTWYFDLPLYSLVPYISERLMLETDFENEARNAGRMRDLIQGEKRLRDRVYIPEVYHDMTSKRVMTAEWIEGVRLWDKQGITGSWYGGYKRGSPGAGRTFVDPPPPAVASNTPNNDPHKEKLKPARDEWKGPAKKGGLGLSLTPVMQTMVDLFSAQMFLWGLVHCDPHPGNIFVRRLPSGQPELVLIDHGLYIEMDPKFRQQYALFWRSLMTFDNKTISEVTKEWGIEAPDIFASATLMRPYEGGDGKTLAELRSMSKKEQKERQFEMQQKMRKGVREILSNQDKFPQELIFIGRNLRIVQGNNQFLGSPVNRVKITGMWASRALAENKNATYGQRWKEYGRHLLFRTVLITTDFVFYWSKLKQLFGFGKGMDDDIEESMRKMASRYV
jgi:aarF domain-containing kinase